LEKTSNYTFAKNELSKVSKIHKNRLFPVFTSMLFYDFFFFFFEIKFRFQIVWGDVKFKTKFDLEEAELPKSAMFVVKSLSEKSS
jgi:hypothetical protein